MAIARFKDIKKMSAKEKENKLKDLRIELIRAQVTANKTNAKTKEIKRTISRIITSFKAEKNTNTTKKKLSSTNLLQKGQKES